MSTISFPYRPPGYLERQGYVKPLWLVKLRRSDTQRNYVPDEEAYDLPAVKAKLESDKYSISTIDHVTLELTRTDELVDFLGGLKDPKRLSIKIFSYLIFRKGQKQLVWFGRLEKLPEGVDAYPGDKLKLTFTSPPGAWEDGDAVKDADTKTWHKNKHVTDLLLPKFLKKAFQQAGPGGGRKSKLDEQKVKGQNYFWSGGELPRKKLARGGANYDDTYQVKSVCWDSSRKVVYMGVWSSYSAQNPWLMSYHPASRKWKRVCGFTYGGHKRFLDDIGWEVLHLEYSAAADKVYYVCQTTKTDLSRKETHYKCYGEINVAAPPQNAKLLDANLFTLHNKGVLIKSKFIGFQNKAPVQAKAGETLYWAYALAESIGWGTPRGEKEHGVLALGGRISTSLRDKTPIREGAKIIFISRSFWQYRPQKDYTVEVYDATGDNRQMFGAITHIEPHDSSFECTVQRRALRYYPPDSKVYLYPPGAQPPNNVFIGKPQNVKVRFSFPKGLKSVDAATVYVEARDGPIEREDFYWPYSLGEIDETGEFYIDRVGYASFLAFRDLEMYDSTHEEEEDPKEYYASGPVAPFEIELEGYNPSFLAEDGFFVASELADHGPGGPRNQAGPCRVVRLQGGKLVTCKVGDGKLKTYGDIFLFKDSSGVWAAWNDHARCEVTGEFFSQCRIAKWDPGAKKFRNRFIDRRNAEGPDRWWKRPECYITSFARYRNRCYGGRRYYDPIWVPTNLQIFWAAPPQGDYKPTGYGGLLTAIVMVTGDRTDLFEAGTIIKLGNRFNEAKGKQYYVSEVETGSRELQKSTSPFKTDYLSPDWENITGTKTGCFRGQVTWMALMSLDAKGVRSQGYKERAMAELGDKYISFMKGRVERHQIWRR
jgi:hypothetical protein